MDCETFRTNTDALEALMAEKTCQNTHLLRKTRLDLQVMSAAQTAWAKKSLNIIQHTYGEVIDHLRRSKGVTHRLRWVQLHLSTEWSLNELNLLAPRQGGMQMYRTHTCSRSCAGSEVPRILANHLAAGPWFWFLPIYVCVRYHTHCH